MQSKIRKSSRVCDVTAAQPDIDVMTRNLGSSVLQLRKTTALRVGDGRDHSGDIS